MTTFLVESYKSLQPDSGNEMVDLLRQISAQIASSSTGGTNGSLPFQNPQPFKPPLWALRVNVLWFASLMLALITASFGMLVKGWLREFLAGEQTSAHTRLRVRFFRYFGLQKWRVFQIAATLPVLLQIALGLFLLGLCFFTSSIHPKLGYTSVPLVLIWALLLIATTLSPLVASHCPYKTMVLKGTLKRLRRILFGHRRAATVKEWQGIVRRDIVTDELNADTFLLPFLEEEDAAIASQWDDHIIIQVDSILADEDLISSVTLESFRQSRPSAELTVDFILQFLTSRQWLPGATLTDDDPFFFPITAPEPEWREVLDFLVQTCTVPFLTLADSTAVMRIVMILVSHRNQSIVIRHGMGALALCMHRLMSTHKEFEDCIEWLEGPYGDIMADIIIPPCCSAWHLLNGADFLDRLRKLLRCLYFPTIDVPPHQELVHMMQELAVSETLDDQSSHAIVRPLYERVSRALRENNEDEWVLTAIAVITECRFVENEILNNIAVERWVARPSVAQIGRAHV